MARLLGEKLRRTLRRWFGSLCTIEVNTPTYDAQHQPLPAWAALDDEHTEIPCRKAPLTNEERRVAAPAFVLTTATDAAVLYGCYPAITVAMRAVIDGTVYDIVGVRHDSEAIFTYLALKTVSV